MKDSEKIGLLMYRYMRNELTPKEKKELLGWRNKSLKHEAAFQEATDWGNVRTDLQWSDVNSQAILEKVKERYPGPWRKEEKKPKVKIWLMTHFLREAAFWIIIPTLIGIRFSEYENVQPHPGTYAGLINGTSDDFAVPIMHDFKRGYQARKANVSVVEHENGDLEYVATSNPQAEPGKNFTHNTYKGNAFMLTLTDVGKIWVNACTSISYPANFSGDTLRIKLSGEAYFEMTTNKPVKIEILSTINYQLSTTILETGNFNVHAYPSEKLKVARDEQSAAWKNKMIYFKDASLTTILNEISRWYDVSVEYGMYFSDKKYNIRLPRDAAFSEVIRVLNAQGAQLNVNGKNILVL